MKAKYGLQVGAARAQMANCELLFTFRFPFCKQSNDYEETKTLKNPKYKNRAESRRQTVGSQGAFQRDDAPASVHE